MIPTIMSWSGGKDSCMALYELQRGHTHRVDRLLTTVTRDDDRIAIHGVHRDLIACQATALGLSLDQVLLPAGASNAVYERALGDALAGAHGAGTRTIAFGDLFLENIRTYREITMTRIGFDPHFPVWGRDTVALMRDFIAAGFRATPATACERTSRGYATPSRSSRRLTKRWWIYARRRLDSAGSC